MIAFFEALPAALGTTLLVSLSSLVIGAVAAVPLLLGRVSRNRLLSGATRALIEVVRGVPPVVWVFIVFFGVEIGSFRFDPMPAAVLAFSLISAAYIAEVYRGGYLSVKAGQFEAAAALGLSRTRAFADVVAPQLFRVAVPGVVAYAVGLLKDTSIVSIIGVADIVFAASRAMRATGDPILPFLVVAALYLAISLPIGLLGRAVYTALRKKVA
ncbi:amino acid ABC transporter permease [Microbacterium betulae]|uniref:Amino acid ABC transporter permease n=1 Tax=Microbacterium betulae TaxID=2981139 RepID=A0AA97I608_9MICO|nr:amino acid ABC transporter permease [Microbacterium sp. AB]WOF23309.1 amino acid ABC transporter permease [Microbacterium sp. AB]